MDYENAGIDVSSKKLQIASQDSEFKVENIPEDHQRLIKRLKRSGRLVVRATCHRHAGLVYTR